MTEHRSRCGVAHERRHHGLPALVRVIGGGILAGVASVPVSVAWSVITPWHRYVR